MSKLREWSCIAVATLVAPAAVGQITERVSVSSAGSQSDDLSFGPVLSDSGRFAVFTSDARNLVAGDRNGEWDILVCDRLDGVTTRVSVRTDGGEARGGPSSDPQVTPDGQWIAFESQANNLVDADTNGLSDVFLHHRVDGTTVRVSMSSMGDQANHSSGDPAISADGNRIVFASYASNLVPADGNFTQDVFLHDRVTGETTLVSVSSTGEQGNFASGSPAISADGRFVVFASAARNLVAGDTNSRDDIFLRDLLLGTTVRLSVSATGVQGDDDSRAPSISADGSRVVFASDAENLVGADADGRSDIFVAEPATGSIALVSQATDGTQGTGYDEYPHISANGRWAVFESSSRTLVIDRNDAYDVFRRDLELGVTERVSVSAAGEEGDAGSAMAHVTPDGRTVAYRSRATNLVPGDTNQADDAFVSGVEIAYDAQPRAPFAGDTVTFGTWGGDPADPAIQRITAVNGLPVALIVAFGNFDLGGRWVFSGAVPAGLQGISIDTDVIALTPSGNVAITNAQQLEFQ